MKVIGITGGVGSGKSQVLAFMKEQFGAVVCQADHVAWKLQEPGGKCYCDIVEYFGTGILNGDKTINRKELGAIVFGDDAKLKVLNAIMHPEVKKEISSRIEMEKTTGTKLFVLEAALLIEEHYNEICDEVWYINADEKIRRQRLKTSRDYTDEKIEAIMASQLSEWEFRKVCHRVIDNSGAFEDICVQIEDLMKQLGEN